MLPVIPCAISLRLTITGKRRADRLVNIDLPDTRSRETFRLDGELPYTHPADYFRSGVNVLRRHGFGFSSGFDCSVHGAIPLNAGTSSSSAMVVTWIQFLAMMSDRRERLPAMRAGALAHEAEVMEFDEPGGMMDQYATSTGGVMAIDFLPSCTVTPLPARLGAFVLGDSGEPKNTRLVLARVKERVLRIAAKLFADDAGPALARMTPEEAAREGRALPAEERRLLAATVENHMITREARELLASPSVTPGLLGSLLDRHQALLRDPLGISTPKIDRMLEAARAAGAYGGKINGSGGGGCMFAYAPEDPARAAAAVAAAGGTAYVVNVDEGTRIERSL